MWFDEFAIRKFKCETMNKPKSTGIYASSEEKQQRKDYASLNSFARSFRTFCSANA